MPVAPHISAFESAFECIFESPMHVGGLGPLISMSYSNAFKSRHSNADLCHDELSMAAMSYQCGRQRTRRLLRMITPGTVADYIFQLLSYFYCDSYFFVRLLSSFYCDQLTSSFSYSVTSTVTGLLLHCITLLC